MTIEPSQLYFPATRAEGLARLDAFLPRAGWRYASHRNADLGPERRGDTSLLSPYLRRRMVSEREVIAAVLEREGLKRSDKFVQEVCWRTYWKGWLEARPEVWDRFLGDRDVAHETLSLGDAKLLADAEAGTTGIEGARHDDRRPAADRAPRRESRGYGVVAASMLNVNVAIASGPV